MSRAAIPSADRDSLRPDAISSSLVVAMLTMPKSTPSQPVGSYAAGSGTSMVARRKKAPSRITRSDSPLRWASNVSWSAEQANPMPFRRPAKVRMDTVCRPRFHDKIQSSYGWASYTPLKLLNTAG